MYNDFEMACHNNTNAFQVHIKVNSESLLPTPQKYNMGSLRIPDDPSWPKIPQRKLPIDAGDTIATPYVVTLADSPQRSHTVVRTPTHQSMKTTRIDSLPSYHHQQNTASSVHTLKRRPGSLDPRFKKQQVITQEAEKPDGSKNVEGTEVQKEILVNKEHNTEIYHAVDNGVKDYEVNSNLSINKEHTCETKDCHDDLKLKTRELVECAISRSDKTILNDSECLEHVTKLETAINDKHVQPNTIALPMQEANGQLLLVVDKNLQAHSVNAIHVDSIAIPRECGKECYKVQFPIVTYQNIPVEITPEGRSGVCQKSPEKSEEHDVDSEKSIPRINAVKQLENTQISDPNSSKISEIKDETKRDDVRNEVITENNTSARKTKEELIIKNNNLRTEISLNIDAADELSAKRFQSKCQESSDSEYFLPNTIKKSVRNNIFERLKIKRITDKTISEDTTDSEATIQKQVEEEKATNIKRKPLIRKKMKSIRNVNVTRNGSVLSARSCGEIENISEEESQTCRKYNEFIYETQTKNKSEENVLCVKADNERKLLRNSEPQITIKRRKPTAKLSKKATSYFEKISHSAMVDSDYTSKWTNCHHTKCKSDQQNIAKVDNRDSKEERIDPHKNTKLIPIECSKYSRENIQENLEDTIKSEPKDIQDTESEELQNNNLSSSSRTYGKNTRRKFKTSSRTNKEDTKKTSKSIPLKTQELLNKSYWEYYNKLRNKIEGTGNIQEDYLCQLTMGAPEVKRRKISEMHDKNLKHQLKVNPGIETLQQCTALSSVINKALGSNLQLSDTGQVKDIYLNKNIKSSSDPTNGTQSAVDKKIIPDILKDDYRDNTLKSAFINKAKRKRERRNEKQFLEIKTIIFFGSVMYILIILLPMLYDYFYHDEYDGYENMSYVELMVEYVFSSFKEAFGGFLNGLKTVFLHSRPCKKCNAVT